MFEPCVLGVDPGVASTGVAAVTRAGGRIRVRWAETIRTPADQDEPSRLWRLHRALAQAIAQHRPRELAVERVMWGRNQTSAMAVARATGVILLAAAQAGVPVEEYLPAEVKVAVTGMGGAGKDRVRHALANAHRVEGVPPQVDAADAVAVAVCHLQQARLRRAARAVAR
ncbi:MAG TPA: crossover junction endodeoxyribonuclease RuvC [Actinomycetota bacterium]|jgi:crossover junction endodeoxyribonuclease RuvC|nr:crossover junction endodeoxyribonuclease RuvC [Actinomycetota bacterium]